MRKLGCTFTACSLQLISYAPFFCSVTSRAILKSDIFCIVIVFVLFLSRRSKLSQLQVEHPGKKRYYRIALHSSLWLCPCAFSCTLEREVVSGLCCESDTSLRPFLKPASFSLWPRERPTRLFSDGLQRESEEAIWIL